MDKAKHSELMAKFQRLLPTAERQENGCLVWTANRPNGAGHAQVAIGTAFRDKSKPNTIVRSNVTRLAWENANGRMLDQDEFVYHSCRTSNCVEPTHLLDRRGKS